MLGIPLVEWVGYVASVLIAASLTMTSIVRLRWVNLFGASLFTVYAVIIGAIPVALVNGFISVVNIYFLVKINKQTKAYRTYFEPKGFEKYTKDKNEILYRKYMGN